MRKLSFWKISPVIIIIVLLANVKAISTALQSVCSWFVESLGYMRNFPEGAQAAIAVAIIGLVIVVTLRVFNK